jgi:hypothetical protein
MSCRRITSPRGPQDRYGHPVGAGEPHREPAEQLGRVAEAGVVPPEVGDGHVLEPLHDPVLALFLDPVSGGEPHPSGEHIVEVGPVEVGFVPPRSIGGRQGLHALAQTRGQLVG